MTGSSTLDPDNLPTRPDRRLGRGHGTGALGPSDTSDSGSDLAGAPLAGDGLAEEPAGNAGPDVGDLDLDSDTDSGGTGERAASGRDDVRDDADIDVDHVETIPAVDIDEDELRPPRSRHFRHWRT
ncbi:hypothetical protein [Massilia glaciei]|uniref:Uncharacterized protein n=1 Tax=Massilia glaciei TaxID=1524097 RepID=A0A2U2I7P4_9BURK|nr:hypothetical protein [Massilia glaciei]PWF55766.1 hypothetical protein C7C56_000150 [Massilia glaciei]